jgi:hypothetical protein
MKNKLFLTVITVFSVLLAFCLSACLGSTDPDTEALLPARQNLSAVVIFSTSIRLAWSPLDGATSYNVYHTTDSAWGSSIMVTSVPGTTDTYTGLKPATTCRRKAAAKKHYTERHAKNPGICHPC